MGNDDARRILLARRARFIAAALASITATGTAVLAGTEGCGGGTEQSDGGDPQPCLSPSVCLEPPVEDSGTDAPPQACLKVAPDASSDADADADAEPQPCLTPRIDGG
jgi:hypothetical protein